jgi:hypothetical protein
LFIHYYPPDGAILISVGSGGDSGSGIGGLSGPYASGIGNGRPGGKGNVKGPPV